MKTIAILSLWLCAISSSQTKPPIFLSYQDSIGQYSFGYSSPISAHSEYRASDGIIHGTYSYIDRNGLIQTAEYEAGKDIGFRVKATNLPQVPLPVQETLEVITAREKHMKLLEEARRREEMEKMMMTMEGRNAGSIIMSENNNNGFSGIAETKRIGEHMMMTDARDAGSSIASEAKEQREKVSSVKSEGLSKFTESQDGTVTVIKATVPLKVSPESPSKIKEKPQTETLSNTLTISNRPLLPIALSTRSSLSSPTITPLILPQPVQFTPEVQAAREAHFRAYETAAKLADETDTNPRLLEGLLRGEAVLGTEMSVSTPVQMNIPMKSKIVYPTTLTTSLNVKAAEQRKESMTRMAGDRKMENVMEKAQPDDMMKNIKATKINSGATPASTSLKIMDIRLPSLNEFQQAKLKSGAYNTPIEISHISPANVLPKSYHPFFRSFFNVYL